MRMKGNLVCDRCHRFLTRLGWFPRFLMWLGAMPTVWYCKNCESLRRMFTSPTRKYGKK